MSNITHVQLMATVFDSEDMRQATDEEIQNQQCQWSVYIGEPGGFSWVADFSEHIDADFFATHLCELHGVSGANFIKGGA